jgi:hypothetical protein
LFLVAYWLLKGSTNPIFSILCGVVEVELISDAPHVAA